jgi:DNA-binding transcriptional MerR regulator
MVPPKLYRIGEVMRYTGLSRQTVHNYTVMGLISEAERTPSGHRLYGERVFERLARIRALRERMTLREIKRLLDGEGEPPPGRQAV